MRRARRALLGGSLALFSACGGGGSDREPGATAEGTTDATGATGVTGTGSSPTGTTPGTDTGDVPTTGATEDTDVTGDTGNTVGTNDTGNTADTGDTDTGGPGQLGGQFLRGINLGYRNPAWGDPDMGWLAGQAGSTSARLSLHEGHLDKWGYEIELGDMESYASSGLGHHIAFLIAPIAAHSTAPDGTPDWELAHYIPKNLHTPAIVDGKVNPENYWAAYVYKTVDTYKDHVDTWEVWNEPDWVADYNFTLTWDEQPPTAAQLVRFGGSIYDYVRMLRVTMEAAKLADPEAKIALGGIGYPSFLAALLRYTDDPQAGAVTPEYPETGAAYFDVLNYHYYPLWTPGNSDAGVDGFFKLQAEFAGKMQAAGAAPRPFSVTEVGAPRSSYDGGPGGVEYARNFYVKVMTRAQTEGFLRVDWFILSDAVHDSAFNEMGLYEDVVAVAKKEDAKRTPTGVAARTHGMLLGEALADPGATAAIGAGPDVQAHAFRLPDDRQVLVLWAYAAGADESAQAHLDLATDRSFDLHAWDFSETGSKTPLAPQGGVIALDLTASPVILVEP
ncbi:MAG TPA: hypothetical protein VGB85_31290 [Nannocystis sp.]